MASSFLFAKIHSLCPLILFTIAILVFTTSHVEAMRRNLATAEGPHLEAALLSILPTPGTKVYGGRAKISVWQPIVATEFDSSLSSLVIQITDDSYIEAGWMVYSERYGDFLPRFSIYWTEGENGCFDLDCEGFQLFEGITAIGVPLEPSVVGSTKTYIDVQIFQVESTGDWQLTIGTEPIGLWPASLFAGAEPGAQEIVLGGVVFDSVGSSVHTETDMGNGLFPDLANPNDASSICSIEYVDASYTLASPKSDMLGLIVTHPLCYNAELVLTTEDGVCFLFGGSGLNGACP